MEWIEAKITTTREAVDFVGCLLTDNGVDGFQVEDDEEMRDFLENNPLQWDYVDDELMNRNARPPVITFYVSDNAYGNEILLSIKTALEALRQSMPGIETGSLVIETSGRDDSEWLDNWKKYYKPFEVGRNIIIKPCWEDYENLEGKLVFNINPGHVFGTGLHQSTRLCISALEEFVDSTTVLLDLGCGSGILSILALMLGAERCVAVDTDANAVDIAYENAELNGVDLSRYKVYAGNVLTDENLASVIGRASYGIVVANIVADVVMALSPLVRGLVKQNGLFISSGIISQRLDEVMETLEKNGFEIERTVCMDEWVSVISRKLN